MNGVQWNGDKEHMRVMACTHLKVVIREATDGEGLSKGSEIRHDEDDSREEDGTSSISPVAGADAAEDHIGEDVVGGEVEEGGEV